MGCRLPSSRCCDVTREMTRDQLSAATRRTWVGGRGLTLLSKPNILVRCLLYDSCLGGMSVSKFLLLQVRLLKMSKCCSWLDFRCSLQRRRRCNCRCCELLEEVTEKVAAICPSHTSCPLYIRFRPCIALSMIFYKHSCRMIHSKLISECQPGGRSPLILPAASLNFHILHHKGPKGTARR